MTVAQHISDLKVCSLYSELSDWIERCRSQIDSSPEGQIASFMREHLVDTQAAMDLLINNLARIEDDRERALAQPIVRRMLMASLVSADMSASAPSASSEGL